MASILLGLERRYDNRLQLGRRSVGLGFFFGLICPFRFGAKSVDLGLVQLWWFLEVLLALEAPLPMAHQLEQLKQRVKHMTKSISCQSHLSHSIFYRA